MAQADRGRARRRPPVPLDQPEPVISVADLNPAGPPLSGGSDAFRAEAERQLALLGDACTRLEQAHAGDALEAARRAAHSLKGAARGIGLGAGLLLGHALEACFIAAQRAHIVLAPASFAPLRAALALYARIARTPPEQFNRWIAGPERDELKAMLTTLDALRRGEELRPAPREAAPTGPALDAQDSATLLDLFHEEADNLSGALIAGLEALERMPADGAALDGCRLAAHSLKGASRIVGLTMAVSVARAIENCLNQALQGGTGVRRESVGLLLRGAELLADITRSHDAEAGQWGSAKRAQVEVFLSALARELAAAPAPAPAPTAEADRFPALAVPLADDLLAAMAGLNVVPGAAVAARAAAAGLHAAAREAGLTMAAALARALEDSLAHTAQPSGEAVPPLRHAVELLSGIVRAADPAEGRWGSARRADVELCIADLGRLRPPTGEGPSATSN